VGKYPVPCSFPREQSGIEPVDAVGRLMTGTFPLPGGFQRNQECAMQAIVDKVMRAFTFKPPASDDAAGFGRQEATEFATKLLENYRQQLALRSRNTGRG
jgi:hypothetical protein